jgi:hypothetical protein
MTKGKLTVEVQHHTFLTSALFELNDQPRPSHFIEGRAPPCDLNWRAEPIANLNNLQKRQSLVPVWNRTPLARPVD